MRVESLKMTIQIKIHLNIYTIIWIINKNNTKNNEMKHTVVYRSLMEIRQVNSQNNLPKSTINSQLLQKINITNRYQEAELQQQHPMDNHNENKEFSYTNSKEKDVLNNRRSVENHIDKETYLKIYNCDNTAIANLNTNDKNNCDTSNSNSNKTSTSIFHGKGYYGDYVAQKHVKRNDSGLDDFKENKKSPNRVEGCSQFNQSLISTYNQLHINYHTKTSDNIDRKQVENIVDEEDDIDDEEEDFISTVARSRDAADDLVNNFTQNDCTLNDDPNKLNDDPNKEIPKDGKITTLKTQAKNLQPLAATAETQTVETSHVQNVTHSPNQRQFHKDLEEQILQGQQLNVHNLLDVAGSICAGPMGALCDMAAFSKLDCSALVDLKDHTPNSQDLLAKKYYHPLYAHGVCRWPGCELSLDDMATFVKHLKTEHCLDDRSTAQARVQMQVVSQLEMHLQKERDRLQAMMHHLYLKKHFVMPEETQAQENISHIRYKNAIRSVSITPDLNKSNTNNSNDDSDGTSDLQSLLINSSNMSATRKRICDKSPLALAGGLPYMLERAGLDVQQEIQRNREFYKNADVRPPFTYASLIRQSIIESPDKQLTLNEIYNWFQNTFCYFRRNAATWKNAIRTNLSLHKCFVRYEDDFGSFWMVDDSEFVKRRHLSRGRPRKYEPSSSPNSNSQQFGNAMASASSNDVLDGGSIVSDTIASSSPDSSTAGSSSRQRCASSGSNLHQRSGNEKSGGNDDYDICEVSQRSPAGCQNHTHSGRKQYCGSKQRPHLQNSIIGVAIKSNINSLIDHNRIISTTNVEGGVIATGNDPGVGGIGDIGSVGSLGVDNQNGHINISNTVLETEDHSGYDFQTQSISNDAILGSPTGSKSNSGRYSPTLQNIWSFGSSLSDDVASTEFACINNDQYRNFVTGLHLQSLTQRHHFHQHKPVSHRIHPKAQQQNSLRSNTSNQQHDVRSLHKAHGYHIYHPSQDEQHQKLLLDQHNQLIGPDVFGVNAVLSNTDKYFSHNIECRSDSEPFKHDLFNPRQQHSTRHHPQNHRSDLLTDEITNHLYIHHHNGYEVDVKYTPPHKSLYNFETHNLNRSDIHLNKRSADEIYSNKTSDAAEEDNGIVDCDREQLQRKRKRNHLSSLDYANVEIKAEADSESELRNNDIPLRTKSY